MKLRRMFFWLFFGVLSFGQLERFHLTPNIAVYLHDFLVVAFLIFTFFTDGSIRKKIFSTLRSSLPWIAFVCLWIVGGWVTAAVVRQQLNFSPVLYFLRLVSYGLFWWLASLEIRRFPSLARTLQHSLAFFFLSILWFGVLQYIFLPDLRFLFLLGWDDHYYRLVSTLLDPAFTGIILVLGFWFLQDFQPYRKSTRVALALAFLAGILLTYSRASYLALVFPLIAAAAWYFWQRRWAALSQVVLFVLLFCVAVPFLPKPGGEGVKLDRTSTIVARTTIAEDLVQSMRGYEWVLGKGLFIDETARQPSGSSLAQQFLPDHSKVADNWVLFILSGTGLVGLGVVVWLGWHATRWLWKYDLWVAVSLVSILLHGLFNASLIYPFVVLVFGGMVVLVYFQREDKTTPRKKL